MFSKLNCKGRFALTSSPNKIANDVWQALCELRWHQHGPARQRPGAASLKESQEKKAQPGAPGGRQGLLAEQRTTAVKPT